MPKTLVLLLITLVVSVLGIGVAYLAGQGTAENRLRAEIERSRDQQRAMLEELKRDLAPQPGAAAPITPVPAATPDEAAAPAAEPPAQPPEPMAVALHEDSPPQASSPPADAAAEPAAASAAEPPPVPSSDPAVAAPNGDTATPSAPAETPAAPIARESFDAVNLGTMYGDVAQRFGRDGLAALTMQDANGTETKHYFWDWIGAEGQACRVSMRFVDGRLMDKIYRD